MPSWVSVGSLELADAGEFIIIQTRNLIFMLRCTAAPSHTDMWQLLFLIRSIFRSPARDANDCGLSSTSSTVSDKTGTPHKARPRHKG